ncbi:MAG: hypothetical protein R6V73_03390 [Anaerolineales bacterium]|jgi:hypothetical protein
MIASYQTFSQQRQLLGDISLAVTERVFQVVDTLLAVAQENPTGNQQ